MQPPAASRGRLCYPGGVQGVGPGELLGYRVVPSRWPCPAACGSTWRSPTRMDGRIQFGFGAAPGVEPAYPVHVKVSVVIDTGRPWPAVRELAREVAQQGVYTVFVPDHFMEHTDDGSPSDGPMLEAWTVLSALAVEVPGVRLGPLVLSASHRHPAVVANMAAALDHVSGGRVVLGVGAGWQSNEHEAYGLELLGTRQRLERLEEHCAALVSLLRTDRTSLAGRYVALTDATCRPAPIQGRLPLLVGGGGERRTLRIAAMYADVWHTWAECKEFVRKSAVLDEHCAVVGRDPTEIRRATGTFIEEVRDVPSVLAPYREAGVDEFVLLDHRARPAAETRQIVEAALGSSRSTGPGGAGLQP